LHTQIGLVDILRALDIEPDGIIGHSTGELGCAYADGCMTAEETIMTAYMRGRAAVETELPDGMMAAIGLGYSSVRDRLPHDVDVACHNSANNCTVSGPTASVMEFVDRLKSEGVFAKAVSAGNISFHSRYIQPAAPTLLRLLRKVPAFVFQSYSLVRSRPSASVCPTGFSHKAKHTKAMSEPGVEGRRRIHIRSIANR
jgi:fatty acid synthase